MASGEQTLLHYGCNLRKVISGQGLALNAEGAFVPEVAQELQPYSRLPEMSGDSFWEACAPRGSCRSERGGGTGFARISHNPRTTIRIMAAQLLGGMP